ncbi:MAG TPA: J domain-containing protein [Nitrospirota bacterium]
MGLAVSIPETEVLNACRALFGMGIDPTRTFLASLQPSDVKAAYRKKAKETHPDLFSDRGPQFQKKQAERFRAVLESYTLVQEFFKQREAGSRFTSPGSVHRAKPEAKPRGRTTAAGAPPKKTHTRFHDGFIPPYRMEIGRYLFYRGRIPYTALIKALSWQRKHRPPIGDIAVRWGWLDRNSVRRIIGWTGRVHLFGERGIHLGILTPFQVRVLLAYQRSCQKKLGRYFVEQGLLRHYEMERLVTELKAHNARIKPARGRG